MNTINTAPVALFVYKRIDCLEITINSLKSNTLAKETELYIFSDGYKNEVDKEGVLEVRKYLKSINGFKNIIIIESDINAGLANSIIKGVSFILTKFDSIIILEDDLETSKYFLKFMNEALTFYKNNASVISIAGYNMNIPAEHKKEYDVYFTKRAGSWGWATWASKWEGIDWEVNDFKSFIENKKEQREFNQMGSDLTNMLKKQQLRKNNSWAIRYCFHQFKYNLYTVYPFISLVKNVGFTTDATHTFEKYNRFNTEKKLNNSSDFTFSPNVELDKLIIKDFAKMNGYTKRIKSKLYNLILNLKILSINNNTKPKN
jgi:hypothetical protein